ncbi:lipase family protein [Nocardioides zeae]|uniref:Lipase family protein n=1 Tax=Nocardioides imazamoxiresistens TaxID=3231893 RepID=A0ABU3PY13_9ACTN|nr:lipase family protein [Nocardioides zeae]MDT9594049.1 lipase family protein [Nocardioides zeae]
MPDDGAVLRRTAFAVTLLGLLALVVAWPVTSLWLLPRLALVVLVVAGVVVGLRSVWRRDIQDPRDVRGGAWRERVRGRRRLPTTVWLVAAAVTVLLVAATAVVQVGSRPTVGDFYTPPDDVPAEAGRLVASEPLDAGSADLEGWRMLYTTVDASGVPVVASAAVVAPREVAGPLPVVTVGHGTSGIRPECAPSATGEAYGGLRAALEPVAVSGAVGVAPDYVGLGVESPDGVHAYLDGPSEASALLDATRAADELVATTGEVVLWGHSQGGHAALWAATSAATYAPDLEVLGVAAMAPATDLPGIVEDVSSTAVGRVLASYLVESWDALHPDLDVRADEGWFEGRAIDRMAARCLLGRDAAAAVAAGSQLTEDVLSPTQARTGVTGELLAAQVPTAATDAPVVVAQGADDALVSAARQRAWVEQRCAAGESPGYVEYADRDHNSLTDAGSPLVDDLVAWTAARVAGEPFEGVC